MQSMENKQPADPPTTYVQVDPHSFRHLVQKLTGAAPGSKSSAVGPRRQAFEALHDRRCPAVRRLDVKPRPTGSSKSPKSVTVDASPVTPLVSTPLFSPREEDEDEKEERAIKEKGYYLRPSPRGSAPPQLLTLFPLWSPEQKQQEERASE